MQKNLPDRIKLVMQFIVFTLGTWIFLVFITFMTGILRFYRGNSLMPFIWGMLVISFVVQGVRLIYRWNKLVRQELAGEFPDMQDPRNLTTFQITNLIVGGILLFGGVIIFQLFSKLGGIICFGIFIPFWVIDKIYYQKRLAKIREANKNSDSAKSTHLQTEKQL